MRVSELIEATGDREFGRAKSDSGARSKGQPADAEEMVKAAGKVVKFMEKPDWHRLDSDRSPLKTGDLDRLEAAIGRPLKTYSGKQLFRRRDKPDGPLADAQFPDDPIAIVKFDDGSKYLIDTTWANSYVRMWKRIDDAVSEADEHTGWNKKAEDDSDETRGWYILDDLEDGVSDGPFKTRAEATSRTKQVAWYRPMKHSIAYGRIDGDDRFIEIDD